MFRPNRMALKTGAQLTTIIAAIILLPGCSKSDSSNHGTATAVVTDNRQASARFQGQWFGRGRVEGNEVHLTIRSGGAWSARVQFGTKNGWEFTSGTWTPSGKDEIQLTLTSFRATEAFMTQQAIQAGIIGSKGKATLYGMNNLSYRMPFSGSQTDLRSQ